MKIVEKNKIEWINCVCVSIRHLQDNKDYRIAFKV